MPRDDAGKTTEQIKLFELYDKDPDLADRLIFGRVTHKDRRGFLRGAGLATMAAILGTGIPFHRTMPSGFVPVAMAATEGEIKGKDGLTVLNDRPVNAETPAHLLDDEVTPTSRHFIRNNGIPPEDVDAGAWELTLDGLVDNPMTLSIADLKSKFEVVTEQLIIECGGNGRAFFEPPAKGNQWSYGAVACSEWTGVRLRDVLQAAGVKSNVVYTAHVGADSHLSGEEGKLPISRGVPIEKAMNPHNLIAFGQNGAEMHPMNGAPLRLVVPGWPGSCSQKWLKRVWLRDQVHDGPKMTGKAYRVPGHPVAAGTKVPKEDFQIIEAMPVKSLTRCGREGAGGPWPCLGGRRYRGGGRSLDRFRRHLDQGGSAKPPQPLCLATLFEDDQLPNDGVLRSLGAGNGQRRTHAAFRHRLEPEGLSQQLDAPRCRDRVLMDRWSLSAFALIAGVIGWVAMPYSGHAGEDYGGLPEGPDRDAVYFNCSACHSIQLVAQQHLSRERWEELLDWMVAENGMHPLSPWARTRVVNYLQTHFGEDAEDWHGLPPGSGREEVFYSCQACHSLAIVKQQGLSRESWEETLVWMVEEQGMPELETSEQELILDYLSRHYGETRGGGG
jgi:DMSO/TMAO reductase YedYZ molybdopterin-dependent catalytic subunit